MALRRDLDGDHRLDRRHDGGEGVARSVKRQGLRIELSYTPSPTPQFKFFRAAPAARTPAAPAAGSHTYPAIPAARLSGRLRWGEN